jgi:hypothetical protein
MGSIPHVEPVAMTEEDGGELSGFWSAWVSGNWRIIFGFEGTGVAQVDLVDTTEEDCGTTLQSESAPTDTPQTARRKLR